MKTRYRDLAEFFEKTARPQQWLADEIDVDRSYISLLVSGQRQPSLSLALRIAELTGVPIESLVSPEKREASA
jgi:transcriptional regulator with XRE-family HTH domain